MSFDYYFHEGIDEAFRNDFDARAEAYEQSNPPDDVPDEEDYPDDDE